MSAIVPESIAPLPLPSLTWERRGSLPRYPCIYFCLGESGEVLYVGRTTNLQQRWVQHHHKKQLSTMNGTRIAYLSVDNPDLLREIEKALIEWFQPPLNTSYPNPRIYKYEKPFDWIHGEKKAGKQFMLTETASAAIDAVAKELGISRSEVVERAARCGGMQLAKKFNPETGECSDDCAAIN